MGYFSKLKEIMNVNRRIILVSKLIDDYGKLCDFLPNYWPWTLWKVLFTWFYISDRLLGCQEQPLLERYAWNLNNFYVYKPVFVWIQSACGSHIHSCDKTWKKGTYDLLHKNPYFLVTTWPNQMGSSLNYRKIVIVS